LISWADEREVAVVDSNDGTGTEDAESADAPEKKESEVAAAISGAIDKLSPAEQLIGLGAVLILLVDLLGDVILDEYGVSAASWIAAVAAIAMLWARRIRGKDFPVSYPWLLTVAGFGGGIAGARDLLTDVESGFLEGIGIVFALLLYAGATLMAWGAYRLSKN
jgi:hypothetical protein